MYLRRHTVMRSLSLFFFSTVPRPPRSTLFPYPTLFRSVEVQVVDDMVDITGRIDRGTDEAHLAGLLESVQLVVRRKSTRLNSSHVEISYAVFCLKKKKKKRCLALNCSVLELRPSCLFSD